MSIKNDIEMVREELTSEEKFFEKSVITERFVKKYKNMIIGGVVVVVLVIGGNIGYDINQESRITSVNEMFTELNKDPSNSEALSSLKTLSPELHDVYIYSVAVANNDIAKLKELKSSKALLVSDLASYEVATNDSDISALSSYAKKQNSIYKDLAQVQSAVLLIAQGKVDEAHEKLSLVSKSSELSKIAKALLHYGVK